MTCSNLVIIAFGVFHTKSDVEISNTEQALLLLRLVLHSINNFSESAISNSSKSTKFAHF